VTKALDVEIETKSEAAGFETESKTEAGAPKTEVKTEAVYTSRPRPRHKAVVLCY